MIAASRTHPIGQYELDTEGGQVTASYSRVASSQAARRATARRWRLLALVVGLLVCSNLTAELTKPRSGAGEGGVGEAPPLEYVIWEPAARVDSPAAPKVDPVVVLLHGAPGQARDFTRLGERLSSRGYRVIAPDMIGFGQNPREAIDYSIAANARAVATLLDALRVRRTHVVGWSQGGGTALHLAADEPGRVASVTLLAAIGEQRNEGSGSFAFEHARYQLALVIASVLPRLVPHFGILDPPRPAIFRAFADSDQRPLAAIMRSLRVPSMVLHGRGDFLIGDWAAERHADLLPGSRLVMTSHSHFIPFLQPGLAAEHLDDFFRACQDLRALQQPKTSIVFDLAPVHRPFGHVGGVAWRIVRDAPWYWVSLSAGLAYLRWPRTTLAVLAVLWANVTVDYGVAAVGVLSAAAVRACFLAGSARPGSHWPQRLVLAPVRTGLAAPWRCDLRNELPAALVSGICKARCGRGRGCVALAALAALVSGAARPCLLFLVGTFTAPLIADAPIFSGGIPGIVAGVLAGVAAMSVVERLLTPTGRSMLATTLRSIPRHEFWPARVFYTPLAPYLVRLAVRERRALAFTAANPGIPNGGGVIDESKAAIMHDLRIAARRVADEADPPWDSAALPVCPTFYIPLDIPEVMASAVARIVADPRHALRWPLILKPDNGLRGFAVRRITSAEHALRYFAEQRTPAVLQPIIDCPREVGILWVRDDQRPYGRILSITEKCFPLLEGDGRTTVEQLIVRHPRFRFQSGVFLARLDTQRLRIPDAGELVRLGWAGNHAQGAIFLDGGDHITPALERTIGRLAMAYPGGLDFGRFDLRYTDEDALGSGRLEPSAIIELNGASSESTNLYDPARSVLWAYIQLFRQWDAVYRAGGRRLREGSSRAMTIRELITALRRHARERTGRALAD